MKAQGGFKNKAPAANGAAIIWKKKMKERSQTLKRSEELWHLWEDGGGGGRGFKAIERW